jgi:hypothetical protein
VTAPRMLRPGPGQLSLALAGVPEVASEPVGARRLRAVRRHERATPPAPPPPPRPTPPAPPTPARARVAPPARSGDLHGAAPTSRQVRAIVLRVEQLPDGRWRLTMPRVPAWCAAASNPGQVAAEIRRAFIEAQIAAYSDWKGTVLDIDVPTVNYDRRNGRRPKRSKPNPLRKDTHPVTAWKTCPDGRWRSPKGLLYDESCQVVQRVIERRRRLGMSPRPDISDHDGTGERQSA